MSVRPDLIVFSHLRWDFVWQRPQHLLTRLAEGRRVFFIEEPVHAPGEAPSWDIRREPSGVTVCRPKSPSPAPGFHDDQMPHLRGLVADLVRDEAIVDPVAWFYTPMAVPLVEASSAVAAVYDCMDELSAFRNAPPAMLEREARLIDMADLVFTGGPSLYRAKKGRHPSVHCFPSSVDRAHFAAAAAGLPDPADQAEIPGPRLGFFGVIDERVDLPLLEAAADLRPDWQFVLVGPVVKIDPAHLPRRPNLHYLGQREYRDLPAYLSGWDVCLLPFARNASTRFISPTKTLEYMAAEKPIVSTSIADVAEPYAGVVPIADEPEAFVAACEAALNETDEQRQARLAATREVLAKTSWDRTAASMDALVAQAAAPHRSTTVRAAGPARAGSPPVVVVGAGPTGLSAAYHLGEDALLLDQNDKVGGWCRSIVENGFTFDYAGHIMFSNDPYVHELYKTLLGDNVHWQDREAWIYSKGVHTRYPFQGALYGLPPEVIRECIMGAIEARFGSPQPAPARTPAAPSNGNGHAGSNGNGQSKAKAGANTDSWCKPGSVEDCCADGVLESTAKLGIPGLVGTDGAGTARPPAPANFEEFIYNVWGAGIAKHFAIPYNRKLWSVPLDQMETSWLGGRVPLPNLEEMIDGALKPVPPPMGPNARFGYPLRGGFQALMDGFLPHLRGPMKLNARVVRVEPVRKVLTLNDGTLVPYEKLISTMPLPVLVKIMGGEAPEEVRQAAAGLRHISVRCVHLGIGREALTDKHWIYYPEDPVFHRIFVQGNASPHCNPKGGFGLTCEITYHHEYKPLPCDGDDLIRRCLEDCKRVGLVRDDDEVWAATQVDMPHAYVVYDHARPKNVATIRDWMTAHDVVLSGRYSEWEYYNSDHAFLAGKKAADAARRPAESLREAAVG